MTPPQPLAVFDDGILILLLIRFLHAVPCRLLILLLSSLYDE